MKYRLRFIFFFAFILAVYPMVSKGIRLYSSKHDTMKKLFLCSSFADVAPLLSEYAGIPLRNKTVAFIPTASIHEEYKQYVEDGRMALDSLGLVVKELEITQCDTKEIAQVLEDCSCIYISGGNTFFLLQELRKRGTDKLIVGQIEKGKLYVGESAGAMIVSPNIEYVKEMDDHLSQTPNFDDFKGLAIVDFYPVPHFNSFPFEEETKRIIQEYSRLPLKPISNLQAIVVENDSIAILGKE